MAPVDGDLADLLEQLAERTIASTGPLQEELGRIRGELADDRRRTDRRFEGVQESLEALDEKCSALVKPDAEGKYVPRAVRVDWKLLVLFLSGVVVPVVVVLLSKS